MSAPNRRVGRPVDRRSVPRGGRRETDRSGRHPNVLVADSYEGARVPCVTTVSGAAAAVHAIANARAEATLSLQERIAAVAVGGGE